MVGAGAVVAQALAGVGPQEDGACMAQQRLPLVGIVAGDFQVLWRDAVADGAGLLHVAREDEGTPVAQALGDDGAPRHLGQQAVDLALDGGDVVGIGAQQDALRQLVMLGLAEQVHGHPVGRRAAVGQHQDFTGAGNHVDAHGAEHPLLGAGHIGIAGAGDLVHLRNGGRAVGQGRHGLGTADGEAARDARHIGGRQHQGVLLAARRGHDHDDFLHASHMGGNGIHQHAGRIGRLAAGHIDAHAVQRRDLLAQQGAIGVTVAPALAAGALLCLVVGAHALGGGRQRIALLVAQAVEGGLELGLRQLQRCHAVHLQSVEARRVLQHGRIAALLHIGQDVGHALLDGRVRVCRPMQALRKIVFEVGVRSRQAGRGSYIFHCGFLGV